MCTRLALRKREKVVFGVVAIVSLFTLSAKTI